MPDASALFSNALMTTVLPLSRLPDRIDPVPEGLYVRAVIKPLYRFIRDQDYESVDGKFVRRERDHDHIIGYHDVNQLF